MKTLTKTFRYSLILLPLFLLFSTCTKATDKQELSISFAGDIIMHIPVKNCARMNNIIDLETKKTLNNDGFDYLFEQIAPRLSASDLTLVNMEFSISSPYKSKEGIFNCPPIVLSAFKKAGISAVTIANNHILDQGQDGAIKTIENLKANQIDYIGAGLTKEEARGGYVFKAKDISAGFLACTGIMNWPFPKDKKVFINWFYDETKMLEDIAAMKQKSDYVILVVHTGVEYMPIPEEKDRKLMKKYLDAGADLIIGHHPHIAQPVETYTTRDGRETCIFYSLGNFISNQSSDVNFPAGKTRISTRNGLVVTVRLTKGIEEKKAVLNAEFDVIPIKTINIRETATRKRQIQTVEFAETETAPPTFQLSETALGGERISRNIEVLEKKITTKKVLTAP